MARCHALLQLARIESMRGETDRGLVRALEASALCDRAGVPALRATCLRLLGDALFQAGRLDEAAAALVEGQALAQSIGLAEESAGCLLNLGLVRAEQEGRLDDAIDLDRRAVESFERMQHASGIAIGRINLGYKLLRANDPAGAVSSCSLAIRVAEEAGNRLSLADARQGRAEALFAMGLFDLARADADIAAALFAEMGLSVEQAVCEELAQKTTQARS